MFINVAGQIGRVLVEFLEVAITSVVFLKGIYPQGLCSFFANMFSHAPDVQY